MPASQRYRTLLKTYCWKSLCEQAANLKPAAGGLEGADHGDESVKLMA